MDLGGLFRFLAFVSALLRNILTNQEIMMDQMKIIYRTVQGLKSVSEEDIGLEANLLPVADLQSLQNLEERLRKFPDFQKQLVSQLYSRHMFCLGLLKAYIYIYIFFVCCENLKLKLG